MSVQIRGRNLPLAESRALIVNLKTARAHDLTIPPPLLHSSARVVSSRQAGGLLSYGPDRNDLYRHAASYVDKILKGAKPTDLPVEQATKLDLVVNLRTARRIGVAIPPSVLARAAQIIE